jgi:hypothetical protein
MSRKSLIKIGAIAIVISVSIWAIEQLREAKQCRRQLQICWSHINFHRVQNDWMYPSNIIIVATCFGTARLTETQTNTQLSVLLTCPSRRMEQVTLSNAWQQSDYVYVNWGRAFGTNVPAAFPLMYDKKMANHFGVNVLTTSGVRFWDFRGRWLREFAQKHPEYELPLPD